MDHNCDEYLVTEAAANGVVRAWCGKCGTR
jgi:hypothetical protein